MKKVFYWSYTFNYNGFIIPYVGIVLNKKTIGKNGHDVLLRHEQVHYEQFKRYGAIIFLISYFFDVLYHGYDLSLFEIEARYEENNFSKFHYTYAVRNGLAETIHNPNFRRGKRYYKPKN